MSSTFLSSRGTTRRSPRGFATHGAVLKAMTISALIVMSAMHLVSAAYPSGLPMASVPLRYPCISLDECDDRIACVWKDESTNRAVITILDGASLQKDGGTVVASWEIVEDHGPYCSIETRVLGCNQVVALWSHWCGCSGPPSGALITYDQKHGTTILRTIPDLVFVGPSSKQRNLLAVQLRESFLVLSLISTVPEDLMSSNISQIELTSSQRTSLYHGDTQWSPTSDNAPGSQQSFTHSSPVVSWLARRGTQTFVFALWNDTITMDEYSQGEGEAPLRFFLTNDYVIVVPNDTTIWRRSSQTHEKFTISRSIRCAAVINHSTNLLLWAPKLDDESVETPLKCLNLTTFNDSPHCLETLPTVPCPRELFAVRGLREQAHSTFLLSRCSEQQPVKLFRIFGNGTVNFLSHVWLDAWKPLDTALLLEENGSEKLILTFRGASPQVISVRLPQSRERQAQVASWIPPEAFSSNDTTFRYCSSCGCTLASKTPPGCEPSVGNIQWSCISDTLFQSSYGESTVFVEQAASPLLLIADGTATPDYNLLVFALQSSNKNGAKELVFQRRSEEIARNPLPVCCESFIRSFIVMRDASVLFLNCDGSILQFRSIRSEGVVKHIEQPSTPYSWCITPISLQLTSFKALFVCSRTISIVTQNDVGTRSGTVPDSGLPMRWFTVEPLTKSVTSAVRLNSSTVLLLLEGGGASTLTIPSYSTAPASSSVNCANVSGTTFEAKHFRFVCGALLFFSTHVMNTITWKNVTSIAEVNIDLDSNNYTCVGAGVLVRSAFDESKMSFSLQSIVLNDVQTNKAAWTDSISIGTTTWIAFGCDTELVICVFVNDSHISSFQMNTKQNWHNSWNTTREITGTSASLTFREGIVLVTEEDSPSGEPRERSKTTRLFNAQSVSPTAQPQPTENVSQTFFDLFSGASSGRLPVFTENFQVNQERRVSFLGSLPGGDSSAAFTYLVENAKLTSPLIASSDNVWKCVFNDESLTPLNFPQSEFWTEFTECPWVLVTVTTVFLILLAVGHLVNYVHRLLLLRRLQFVDDSCFWFQSPYTNDDKDGFWVKVFAGALADKQGGTAVGLFRATKVKGPLSSALNWIFPSDDNGPLVAKVIAVYDEREYLALTHEAIVCFYHTHLVRVVAFHYVSLMRKRSEFGNVSGAEADEKMRKAIPMPGEEEIPLIHKTDQTSAYDHHLAEKYKPWLPRTKQVTNGTEVVEENTAAKAKNEKEAVGLFVIVMPEYGENLWTWMEKKRETYKCLRSDRERTAFETQHLKDVRTLAGQLSDTLAELHTDKTKKIFHRDLKPNNVVLKRGKALHVKLLDFGSCATNTLGEEPFSATKRYAPPDGEKKLRFVPNARYDVYSLGCMILEFCDLAQKLSYSEKPEFDRIVDAGNQDLTLGDKDLFNLAKKMLTTPLVAMREVHEALQPKASRLIFAIPMRTAVIDELEDRIKFWLPDSPQKDKILQLFDEMWDCESASAQGKAKSSAQAKSSDDDAEPPA